MHFTYLSHGAYRKEGMPWPLDWWCLIANTEAHKITELFSQGLASCEEKKKRQML